MQVLVYSKPRCSTCDDARELLEEARAHFRFELTVRNVYEDEALFAKYRYTVPVVVVGGIEVLSLKFTQQELEAALAASGVERK